MKFWKEGKDCCSWSGVTCDMKTGQVVDLDLSYSWLQGPLRSNSSLFKLPELQKVNLAHNNFSFSKIPSNLAINLSSSIPESLTNLSSLTFLQLSGCDLYGRFPEKIFQLPKLELILVPCNPLLYGFLPQFHNSSSLRVLNLDAMNFSGKLPDSIGKLESLIGFSIGKCNFVGPLPPSISNLSNLEFLCLSYNQFNSSGLPSTLGNLAKLVHLFLRSAQFSGEVPPSLGNLTQLKNFDISYNNLSLTKLNTIYELPKFQTLALGSCNLSEFPSFLKTQDQLEKLDLSSNRIEGQIPKWFWGIAKKKLEMLDLSHNKLQGSLDASPLFTSFFEISKIKRLILKSLTYLRTSSAEPFRNGWSMPELQVLVLRWNKFYGPIWHPYKFRGFESLRIMDLSFNNFSGRLPSEYFTNWVGMIQATYGNKKTLIYMEDRYPFTYNRASMIVISKGVEIKLERILKTLTSIDLSNNRFDGEIPSSIGNLQNQLTGPIPQGKQLDTFSSSSFAGNPGLCGFPLSRNCETVDSPVVHHAKEVESGDGFTWKPVAVGYGFGIVVGFIIGHVILSQRRSTWFWRSFVGKFIYAAC
ncbi:hypothetical protein FNV43_RR01375 [Rhamnella rubrinervis]|uniref:Disease resistance R13L4/SHOC-2-like LRR domain-containing protein n=1 Tax=Rhamnella rubrinervis TaxID=2594499 RepID=A0A8K0HPI2_9ROSA|nr:hypothetical protein FNV43_RR01375 [Rhamnella rubrinervis]